MNVFFKNGSSFTSIYDLIYPVGSIFIGNTNAPGNYFGGAWGWLSDECYLENSGETWTGVGGVENSNTRTLSWDNMPSHNHQMPIHRNGRDSGGNDTSRQGGLIALGHDGNVGYGGNVMLFNPDNLEDSNWTTSAGNGTEFSVKPLSYRTRMWLKTSY